MGVSVAKHVFFEHQGIGFLVWMCLMLMLDGKIHILNVLTKIYDIAITFLGFFANNFISGPH